VDDGDLRAALVATGARLGARGLVSAGEGNLSIRLPGARLLITPSGRRKDELGAGDLVIVPLDAGRGDGQTADGGRASSDVAIHRAVMSARPDVTAVVHAHLPAAMALTLAGDVPDPAALPETALLLPRLPFVNFGVPGSVELAARIATAFSDGGGGVLPGAVLLERHGAVAVGGGAAATGAGSGTPGTREIAAALSQAVDRLELVEVLCRTWRDALLVRAARRAVGPD
jgi:L-fuculose-phosphate aldolase